MADFLQVTSFDPLLVTSTPARGITSIAINGSNHLIITYTDGTTADAGLVGSSTGTVKSVDGVSPDGAGNVDLTATTDARYVQIANSAPLSNATPQALGTAGPGTASSASRSDHVHPAVSVPPSAVLPVVGGWIGLTGCTSSTNAAMPNSSIIYFSPLIIPAASTWDQIGLRIGTAGTASQVLRMGIYAADSEGKPATLVLDAGTMASDSTGTKAITIASPVTLQAGLYWIGTVVQVATTAGCSVDFGNTTLVHVAQSGNQNLLTAVASGRYRTASTYPGALPSSVTADLIIEGNSSIPLFQMHRSA